MSIKSELQRCVADYLRKYLVEHGEWGGEGSARH